MNTGIQDAWNLSWKLALVTDGTARPQLLDTYQTERMPIGRDVLRLTDRAFRIATSRNPLVRWMRSQVAPRLLPRLAQLRRTRASAFRTIAQLNVSYRRSLLVEEGETSPSGGPRAGDRFPDLRLDLDGLTIWIQELLVPTTFHLLLCGPPDEWDEVRINLRERYEGVVAVHWMAREGGLGVLVDRAGEALRRRIERLGLYLVRPDGYIAYRSAGEGLVGLERYLRRWIRRPDQRKA